MSLLLLESVRPRRFSGSFLGDLFVVIVKRPRLLLCGDSELVMRLATSGVEEEAIHSDLAPTLRWWLNDKKMSSRSI
jgi:hypothetical protein